MLAAPNLTTPIKLCGCGSGRGSPLLHGNRIIRSGPFLREMWLLVASSADEASLLQRESLLRLAKWTEIGRVGTLPILRHDRFALVTIPDLHLYHDRIDHEAVVALSGRPDVVVFLSKHRSESRTPSLTVHPIGNISEAQFGGQPRQLVPAAAQPMTDTLRAIRREARGLPYAVTFEATHHGPYLESPAFFIEAGSTEVEWRDSRAAEALMRALISVPGRETLAGIGVGGGHYVPRITDVAFARDVAFGHLVPEYALATLRDEMVDQLIAKTPGASFAYFHRKSIEKATLRRLEGMFESRGLRSVHEDELPLLPPEQRY